MLVEGLIIKKLDPICTVDYCNYRGICYLVDVKLTCYCNLGYVGTNCQVDSNGYTLLSSNYVTIYNSIFATISQTNASRAALQSAANMYQGASSFFQDNTFQTYSAALFNLVTFVLTIDLYKLSFCCTYKLRYFAEYN